MAEGFAPDFRQQRARLIAGRQRRQPRMAALLEEFRRQRNDPLSAEAERVAVCDLDPAVQAWIQTEELQVLQERRLAEFMEQRALQEEEEHRKRAAEGDRRRELKTRLTDYQAQHGGIPEDLVDALAELEAEEAAIEAAQAAEDELDLGQELEVVTSLLRAMADTNEANEAYLARVGEVVRRVPATFLPGGPQALSYLPP